MNSQSWQSTHGAAANTPPYSGDLQVDHERLERARVVEHAAARRQRGAHRRHEPVEDRAPTNAADGDHPDEHARGARGRAASAGRVRCSMNVSLHLALGLGRRGRAGSRLRRGLGSCGLRRGRPPRASLGGRRGGDRRRRAGSASAASRPGTFSAVAAGTASRRRGGDGPGRAPGGAAGRRRRAGRARASPPCARPRTSRSRICPLMSSVARGSRAAPCRAVFAASGAARGPRRSERQDGDDHDLAEAEAEHGCAL